MSDNMNVDEILKEYGQEQSAADEDMEVEVKGKKYKASQIEEYERGYLRQSDYTKKTQELAENKRLYDAQIAEYTQLKNQLGVILQKDPSLMTYAQGLLSGQAQPGNYGSNNSYADDPYMKEIQATKQAINQLYQWQQDTASKVHEQELDREITVLQKKYPKMDVDKVLGTLSTQPTLDLEELAKTSHEEMTQRINSELHSMAEQRQRQKRALVEGSGGRTAGLGKPAQSPRTRAELEQAVNERLKMLNSLGR